VPLPCIHRTSLSHLSYLRLGTVGTSMRPDTEEAFLDILENVNTPRKHGRELALYVGIEERLLDGSSDNQG